MKALVYTNTQKMEYRDEPEPTLESGDVLVRITAAGICGSDMHAYHGHDERRIPPLILGHEAVGIVTSGQYEGLEMAINPLITCGSCHDCLAGRVNLCPERDIIGMKLAGAFAEYIKIPESNLIPLPDNATTLAASLMEPTAVSLHAVLLAENILNRPISESRTLVIGGGAIGLLAALVLKQKGAAEIFLAETNQGRRRTVADTHCCTVFDPMATELPDAASFDLVVDAVGTGATRAASCHYARPGGVISHIGLQDNNEGLDVRRLTLQEITFIGNYTYTPIDLRAALSALSDGSLGSLDWVQQRPLQEGESAFTEIHNGTADAPKIVLLP